MCFCFRKKKQDSSVLNSRIAASGTLQSNSASLPLGQMSTSAPVSQTAPPGSQTPPPGSQTPAPVSQTPPPVLQMAPPVLQTPALVSRPPTAPSIPHAQHPPAVGNAIAQSVAPTLWEKAIQRLNDDDRKLLALKSNSQDTTELDILQVFVQEAEKQRDECERRQWKYTNSGGEEVPVRNRVNTLLVNLNKYTFIGDLVVQPLPSVVSLAWGGFKALLQVAMNDMENTAIAMESLDSLARILGHCAIYEKLYGDKAAGAAQSLAASESLSKALVELYTSVLEYLCYLKHHLGHNTAVQSFKNIASGVKSRWETLLDKETAVDKEAGVAQQEAMEKHMFVNDARIKEILVLLKETSAPILQIQSTVEEIKAQIEETKHTVQDIFKTIKKDERLEILNWISDVSHKEHHEFNKSVRSPGTGRWLLEKPNFQGWDETDLSSLLWLHGIAGSGKTTLTSKIIDDMEPETTEYSLAYFYCNYKEDQRRDPASIARSLVKQLCLRTPGVGSSSSFPAAVLALYSKRKENADLNRTLSIDECKNLLIELSTGFLRTTIIVDALDECDPETRGKLCDLLAQVVSSSKRVKVFITSRDEGDLRARFEDSPNVYIQERDNSADINCYIEAEIQACIDTKKLLGGKVSVGLRKEVIDALQLGAHGMFIWVKHLITMICDEATEEGVYTALKELPKDTDDLYSEILRRIRAQKSRRTITLADRTLTFILCAVRPLSDDELTAAVAYPSSKPTVQVLLDICRGLVVLDKEFGVLRFAHFSVQEFLVKQNLEENHATVAETCLKVLLASDHKSARHDMLKYSAINWHKHVRQAGTRSDALCIQFLTPSPAYIAWVSIASKADKAFKPHESEVLSPLIVACLFQLVDIVKVLLGQGANPDSANSDGRTSLHAAAASGNHGVTRLVLKHAAVNIKDKDDRTPLSLAAQNGHDKVVHLLLEKGGVDVDSKNKNSETPLSLAAKAGHDKVVHLLLEKGGVDVDSKNKYNETPLSSAAEHGHDKVVHLLLEKSGVDVDSKDKHYRRTPLSWAAEHGHDKVVHLLLEKSGVDVDSKDRYGRTPLSSAARGGFDKVVHLLLEKGGVDVDSRDGYGRTILSLAAARGDDKVVHLLLEKGGVDVDSKDGYGRTPLSWAAEHGHDKVVHLLLEKGGVDVDSKASAGKTPLFYAQDHQHQKVVEMLLAKGAHERFSWTI